MNDELWVAALSDRIRKLERRAFLNRCEIARQRKRAELWKHRALTKAKR